MERIRILVADDHPVSREGLVILLAREADMEVVAQASDGVEAVDLAQRTLPDVAILDVCMPNLDGIEATRGIKAACPHTAVLILTAYGYDAYVMGAMEAGAAGYLLKSVRMRDLLRAIRALRVGEMVLGPTATRKVFSRLQSSANTDTERPPVLDARELEVLRLVAKGLNNRQLARALGISVRTCQNSVANIMNKLGVGSRTEAVVRALRERWLMLDDLV
jgi:NarL family two-component system response regulator LiaR